MKYHLHKASRSYQGNPYQGPSNENQRAESDTLQGALRLYDYLMARNGVGWNIYNSETRVRVCPYCVFHRISRVFLDIASE